MLEKLMPRSDEFFDDFERQVGHTLEGVKLLKSLLDDFTDVKKKVLAIKNVEHAGDEATHASYERLHKQFITPFDRGDIHRLLKRIDDVLDLADAAAERLSLYEITSIPEDAKELGSALVAATEKVVEAIRALRKIKQPKEILEACKEVRRWETHADGILRQGLARLFKSGADPLEVIKWKEILDLLETATDRCADVVAVIEGVVLEHS